MIDKIMDKIKVALSAIWYPMAMASYFWRAFLRRKDVDLFVVGPFTDTWIPWAGGMYLPRKYVMTPDLALPGVAIGMNVPPDVVNNQLPWTPDIFIQVDAGFHYLARPKGNIVAHVQTDPHVLKPTYEHPKSYSDLNFCMQYSYMKEGEIYLPYAYDPTVHYPMPEQEKVYDACLIGLHYETRNALVEGLQREGLIVKYGIGDVYDEFRLAYNRSKVALSWSSALDIPARVFEAMGMAIPLVANRIPDMDFFFKDGIHYLGFDTAEEGVNQVMRIIQDYQLWMDLSLRGYSIIRPHTWDNRVEQILREAKLI